jgi:DNA processing protein
MKVSSACLALYQLSSIKGLGLKTFHHLYSHLGSVENIISTDFELLKALGVKASVCRAICQLQENRMGGKVSFELERLRVWAEVLDQYILCIEDVLYPPQLKEIYCPPPIIYLKGCPKTISVPAVGIVGSRKPSVSGKQHAFMFARGLSLSGFCINSGLALGVDTAAHEGALQASGITCAVLGTGLDVVYPKQNAKLARDIVCHGALISEMSLGCMPVPSNFPRRNRIISGLSKGVLVVEAGLKSGSLLTANYAVEQNRDVYAVPGPIDSLVSAGCHALIQQGAKLVTCIEDILDDNATMYTPINARNRDQQKPLHAVAPLSSDEAQVLEFVDYQRVSFDVIAELSGFNAGRLTQILMELELKGTLCSVPGGYQRLKPLNLPA